MWSSPGCDMNPQQEWWQGDVSVSLLRGLGGLQSYLERNSGSPGKLWSPPACRNAPADPPLYSCETQLTACSSWPWEGWWLHEDCCQPCLVNEEKVIPFLLFSLHGVSVPALQPCISRLALARGGQAELCWCGAALCTFFSMMPGTPFPQGLKILLLQQSASGAKS